MARVGLFKEDDDAPDGIWCYLFDNTGRGVSAKPVSKNAPKKILVEFRNKHFYYSTLHSGYNWMLKGSRKDPHHLTLNYWVAEFEQRGYLGVQEDYSLFLFRNNIPQSFRKHIAIRYDAFRTAHQSSVMDNKFVASLCHSELESILQEGNSTCDAYVRWILSSNKKNNPYPSELLTYLFPSVMEMLDRDPRDKNKIIQGLVLKLEENLARPHLILPSSQYRNQ